MTNPTCQETQLWLLESESGRPQPAHMAHLRNCAECRAFAQDVLATGAMLGQVARGVTAAANTALDPELKAHVLGSLLAELERTEKKSQRSRLTETQSAVAAREAEAIFGADSRRTWRERLSILTELLFVRGRWATVAVLLLAVAGLAALAYHRNQPIGNLEFATGPTLLASAESSQDHRGLGHWTYRRDAKLTTPQEARAIFTLGSGVRAAMDEGTQLQLLAKEKLSLQHGTVWLSVTPGGKGFAVQTPFALVTVTGTHFGVTVTDHETRVDVSEGSVLVAGAQNSGKVVKGQTLAASDAGVGEATSRKEGVDLPAWVNGVFQAEKIAQAGAYLPSIK